MENNTSSADELKTIRKMMEESSKFLSLSGFSGLFLGLFAVAGAIVAWFVILGKGTINYKEGLSSALWLRLAANALTVLVLSLVAGFWFSFRNAKKSGKSFWTPASKRMLLSLVVPLAAGGLFAFILMLQNQPGLIIPVFLIFYGLALVNAGKFTYCEIFYLGLLEIITGLFSAIFPAQGLLFWVFGFGILHIVYGVMMYRKYEV
jgi:hypothetical protein